MARLDLLIAALARRVGVLRRYLVGVAEAEIDADRQVRQAVDLLESVMHHDDPVALNQAIDLLTTAVVATPTDHPDRATYLSNLGIALRVRFGRTGAGADLDEAIRVGREAATATPTDHPNRSVYLSNLGIALRARFERAGAGADLDEAIRVGREAAAATPTDHPYRAGMLSNLGSALLDRFERAGAGADLDEAVRAWSQAGASTVASATTRLTAARGLAQTVAQQWGPAAALDAYTAAVNLLPLLTWRGIGYHDQQHLLHHHAASLARDAAACAIAADRLDTAVELLEQGRGVYWSQLLDIRTDLTALQHAASHLAEQLLDCRVVLDQPVATTLTG